MTKAVQCDSKEEMDDIVNRCKRDGIPVVKDENKNIIYYEGE